MADRSERRLTQIEQEGDRWREKEKQCEKKKKNKGPVDQTKPAGRENVSRMQLN